MRLEYSSKTPLSGEMRSNKFVRFNTLLDMTALSRAAAYQRMDPRPENKYYDPTFPRPVNLSASGPRGAKAWLLSEIEDWMSQRVEIRNEEINNMRRLDK